MENDTKKYKASAEKRLAQIKIQERVIKSLKQDLEYSRESISELVEVVQFSNGKFAGSSTKYLRMGIVMKSICDMFDVDEKQKEMFSGICGDNNAEHNANG
jgi:hypothetical protein